ncbi:MAG: hypothetical protein IIB44_07370 [Candidatus Marinimicrobia bacterium]|nr:hypothetical protein [Candidatus Neomarinimicrobiota bacterium]
MLNYDNMEIPLPNYQSLENRINQLADELKRLREYARKSNSGESTISNPAKESIEVKIKNIIELLEEFESTYL